MATVYRDPVISEPNDREHRLRSDLESTRWTASFLDRRIQLNNFLQANGEPGVTLPYSIYSDLSLVTNVPRAQGVSGEMGEADGFLAWKCYAIFASPYTFPSPSL